MNHKNLLHLIETMRAVQERDAKQDHSHFDMNTWAEVVAPEELEFYDLDDWYRKHRPGLHECGTTACALGWEALTSYANKRGLRLNQQNYPVMGRLKGAPAAAKYFDLPVHVCEDLFIPHGYQDDCLGEDKCEITPQDVINKITLLLGIGEEDYLRLIGYAI